MRRVTIIAAGALALLLTAAAPASAGYGALARDDATGKYGLSTDEATQAKADEVATKECGSDKCSIVFRTVPRECGAIATAETGNAWGAGKRMQRAAAELDAVNNCQKRTKGQCKMRTSACNK